MAILKSNEYYEKLAIDSENGVDEGEVYQASDSEIQRMRLAATLQLQKMYEEKAQKYAREVAGFQYFADLDQKRQFAMS